MVSFGKDRLEPLFKIGLRPLDLAQWFEPDGDLAAYRAEKDRLTVSDGELVFRAEPGTEAAQAEVRALLIDNLARYHPQISLPADSGGPDLLEAARCVQEDLVLMRLDPDADPARWRMVAASLHFPSSWKLGEKISRPLDEIHDNVPGFGPNTRNAGLMARIFDGLKVEQPVQRMNWTLYPTPTLHHPYSARDRGANPGRHTLDAASFIRVERQTLRKLPQSGDILFTIRIYIDPIAALARHPETLGALKANLQALTPAERDYKGLRKAFDDVMAVIEGFEGASDQGASDQGASDQGAGDSRSPGDQADP